MYGKNLVQGKLLQNYLVDPVNYLVDPVNYLVDHVNYLVDHVKDLLFTSYLFISQMFQWFHDIFLNSTGIKIDGSPNSASSHLNSYQQQDSPGVAVLVALWEWIFSKIANDKRFRVLT